MSDDTKNQLKILFKAYLLQAIRDYQDSEKAEEDLKHWISAIVNAEETFIIGLIDLEKLKNE